VVRRALGVLLAALSVAVVGACSSSDDTGSTAAKATTTTAPVLPEGACVARMSDPNPGTGGSETVIVDSHFASLPLTVTAHYKSKDSTYSASLGANRHAEARFSIGQPTAGYPVTVDVAVGTTATGEKCQASFTPH
jgi:hypothetical protein